MSSCSYGYRGYSYRQCTDGSLGAEVNTNCVLIPPENIHFPASVYVFVVGQTVSTGVPSFKYTVSSWLLSQTLPSGLSFNSNTGEISGVPTTASSSTTYSVTARNDGGSASGLISIEVIPEFFSFPQTTLIIGQGLSFTLTPTLQRSAVVSVFSGSLPAGLTLNPSNGVISGTPTQKQSSQSVTINAQSDLASQKTAHIHSHNSSLILLLSSIHLYHSSKPFILILSCHHWRHSCLFN